MNIRQATLSDVPVLVSLNRIAQDMHAEAFPGKFRRNAPNEVVAEAMAGMMGVKVKLVVVAMAGWVPRSGHSTV